MKELVIGDLVIADAGIHYGQRQVYSTLLESGCSKSCAKKGRRSRATLIIAFPTSPVVSLESSAPAPESSPRSGHGHCPCCQSPLGHQALLLVAECSH